MVPSPHAAAPGADAAAAAPLSGRRDALVRWFDARRRPLPWREAAVRASPYRVLVSEVMLQQTRVDTVVRYFPRWLERFPDLPRLAEAPEAEVLRAWEGLGYYRRARNLHAAARQVCAVHGGILPAEPAELEALPGIGRYTARAVAALAFGRALVAVDANVRRIAARVAAAAAAPSDRRAEELLAPLATGRRGAEVGEALIELGALVCTPRAPRCDGCPLRPSCAAARGDPEAHPRPVRRPPPPVRRRFALVADDGARVWLARRPDGALLGGLWGFPQAERAPAHAPRLPEVRHAYSHFRLLLTPVRVEPAELERWLDAETRDALRPVALEALERTPLSVLDRRLALRLGMGAPRDTPASGADGGSGSAVGSEP